MMQTTYTKHIRGGQTIKEPSHNDSAMKVNETNKHYSPFDDPIEYHESIAEGKGRRFRNIKTISSANNNSQQQTNK